VGDPAEEEAVRAKAESVLEKLKAGGDFAALAREYSEDQGSAEQGGYLGTFPRGRMVKEFEDAAFSLEPGQISELVRTPDYGFHIIKVLQHNRPTLESNRNSLVTAIRLRKAKDLAKKKAEEAAEMAANGKDLSAIAEELDSDSEVKETGLFDRDESPYSMGISQALSDDIFKIEEVGALGSVVEHTLGFAFAKLQEIQKTRPGRFEEFTDQVKADLINVRSRELMEAEAKKLSEDAALAGSLAKAAGKLGYDVKTSKDFKVDETPDPEIEDADAFNYAAFELEQGSVSQPIVMTDTAAVLEVKDRSEFDEAAFEEGKEALHDELYASLQQNYLEAYFRSFQEELEEDGKIRVNPEVFDLVDSLRF
ncbi:MAG: peptidylprolyl isomerase, partial [Acidobacteriota bacterium]